MKAWLYVGMALLVVGSYAYGRHDGSSLAKAEAAEDMLKQAAATAAASAKLMLAEQETRKLAQSLEDLANEEPITNPACLPVSRVRRLNLR